MLLLLACSLPDTSNKGLDAARDDTGTSDAPADDTSSAPDDTGSATEDTEDTEDTDEPAAELRARLDADPRCFPADVEVAEHAPSWERGRFFEPTGGSDYDPRLAGCTLVRDKGGEEIGVTYDELGRISNMWRRDAATDLSVSYTWSDEGCREEERTIQDGMSYLTVNTCDAHGYPLCWTSSWDDVVVAYTNTYEDGDLVAVDTDAPLYRYSWADGRVVSWSAYGGGELYVHTITWEDEHPVRVDIVSSDPMDVSLTWEWDPAGRVTSYADGTDTWTYLYEGDARWPSASLLRDGSTWEVFTTTCD